MIMNDADEDIESLSLQLQLQLPLLPKLTKLCFSYLFEFERKYYQKKWDEIYKNKVCFIAADNGWLDLLKWARSKNHPWESNVYVKAGTKRQIEMLKWVIENNCPCDQHAYYIVRLRALENNWLEIEKMNGDYADKLYADELAKENKYNSKFIRTNI